MNTINTANKNDWKKILPGLVITIIAVVIVLNLIDLDKFVAALRQADYRMVLVAILLTIVWLLVRSIAWRTLLREQATFNQVFFTINEGYVLNNILPFRLGEIGRAFILGKKAKIGFWEVFSTIVMERIFDLAFAVSLLLVSIPLIVGAEWALETAVIAGGFVLLAFLFLYLLARYRDWASHQFSVLSERFTILNRFGVERVNAFFNGLEVLRNPSRFIQTLLLFGLDWGIGILQYTLLLKAFYPEANFLMGMFTLGVAAVGVAAPSSPGAVGVFELLLVGALSIFDLDPSSALAYAISLHLIQYLVTGVLGLYAFIRDGESVLAVYRKSRELPGIPNE